MKTWVWILIIAIILVIVYFKFIKKSKKQELVDKVMAMCKKNPNCDADAAFLLTKDEAYLQGILDGTIK